MAKDRKYTQEIILIEKARASYPNLLAPTAYKDGPKSYSVALIVDKNSENAKLITTLIPKMFLQHFGANAQKILNHVTEDKKSRFYEDGDKKLDKDLNQIPYLAGQLVLTVKTSEDQPHKFFTAEGKEVDFKNPVAWQAEGRKFYGGCYVNAAVQLWVQDNDYGRAIRAKLIGIQFAGDGEALGGTSSGPDVSSLFKPSGGATASIPPLPSTPFGSTPAFVED